MPGIFLALITSVVGMALPVDAQVRPQLVVGVMMTGSTSSISTCSARSSARPGSTGFCAREL